MFLGFANFHGLKIRVSNEYFNSAPREIFMHIYQITLKNYTLIVNL